MIHLTAPFAFFLTHLWHYFYVPTTGPWYSGLVWSNVFVIAVVAPLGWLWSKSKFWPLNLVHQKLDGLHAKHDQHAETLQMLSDSVTELHAKHDALHERLNGASPDLREVVLRAAQRVDSPDEAPPGSA